MTHLLPGPFLHLLNARPRPAARLTPPPPLPQVLQARAQAARRHARHLAAEDVLFLLRHDRPRLARIRAYLSSRSAHQKYAETGEAADDDREVEGWAFQIDQSGTG